MSPWAYLADTEEIESNIEGSDVGPHPVVIIEIVDLRCSIEDKVHVWDPDFIGLYDCVPDAAHDVDEHEHLEYQIYNFVCSLGLLTRVQIKNDVVDSLKPQNLQDTQKLKESCAAEVII